jgi:hypothetical protein
MRIGHYTLQIHFSAEQALHSAISDLLGICPITADDAEWNLHILEKDFEHADFINLFLDILEGKYQPLQSMGIKRDQITFWAVYEYLGQCNTEFPARDLARLGTNGIHLCISCWENPDLAES